MRVVALAGLLAIVGTVIVLVTLDDPGLTIDEPINVGHGKRMWYAVSREPGRLDEAPVVDWLWRNGHEHPPLARFLIGAAHSVHDPHGEDPAAFDPKGGRAASAIAYGVLLFFVTVWGSELGGLRAGAGSALALLTMPRVFGHAHLASPEVISSAAVLVGLWVCGRALDAWQAPRAWITCLAWSIGCGLAIGIALLTKLTACLLPIALVIVALISGWRAVGWTVLAGVISLVTFIGGWPWLWPLDLEGYSPHWLGTMERLIEFLRMGVDRAIIYVEYFGRQYPHDDGRVPWHFAIVMFAITVPLTVHGMTLAALIPMWRQVRSQASARLLAAFIATVLIFFSLPVERYDGERLFLIVFAPYAIVAGLGAGSMIVWLSRFVGHSLAVVVVISALLMQATALWRLHPYQLSYYSMSIGGLAGAHERGLEATYWGDTLADEILFAVAQAVPPNTAVMLVPTLYAGHAQHLTTPALADKGVVIVPQDNRKGAELEWALLFNRGGYLMDDLPRHVKKNGEIVAEVAKEGVWLARLYRLAPTKPASRISTAPGAD